MRDEEFLGKISGLYIGLIAAILCHSLPCGRTGHFIDNVSFTHANTEARYTAPTHDRQQAG